MKKEIIFNMESPFRDNFRITGYHFGSGEKSLALVGAMRGDEVQQQYVCSQVIHNLMELEEEGKLIPGHEILVIPSANPFSMNIEKRFWAMDSTDINRMFPGYDKGETTQRIASAVFEAVKGYTYGIQMASFYLPGDFIPHVRITKTGYEDVDTARKFGLPYISLHTPLPFDTTLLNYNWQIFGTKAYSIYGGQNENIDDSIASDIVGTLLRFMHRTGLLDYTSPWMPDNNSHIVDEATLTIIKAPVAGILYMFKGAGEKVRKGELLAHIIDPYEGNVMAEIKSPKSGIIFFARNKSLTMQNTLLFNIL